ncbi:hypothetical protein [Pedobacter chitinilyticus]|uniref:Uncharacterized protein n=1 Tax=Pedobacter chitinilyticus TaxID=2233776 RepID=A0A3S3PCI1_9SPHI|nr:hypothetical protein [Pedobacter chitinilyticus]RWU08555.1 hypothetical protein DPV69_09295 [Pedobacter chitinilyticus]
MKILALNALLWLFATAASAQELAPTPKADFANWVIESNVKTPKISTVKFYNAKQELIYQEVVEGKRLNVRKEKVKKKLNEILVQLAEKNTKINQYNLVALSL